MSVDLALARFAMMLRELGIRVTTAELLDAARALVEVGVTDRERVRVALASAIVKDSQQMPAFNRAFDLFFSPPEVLAEYAGKHELMLSKKRQELSRASEELLFLGEPVELTDLQKSTYARLKPEDQERIREFLDRSTHGKKVGPNFRPLIESIVQGHLDRWRQKLREEGIQVAVPVPVTGDALVDGLLDEIAGMDIDSSFLHRDLGQVRDEDLPYFERVTRELSHRLATRLSRRYRMSRRNAQVDIRRTVRASISQGGVPFRLKFRARKVQKPRLLLFADISGSMSKYSGFVVQFLLGLASVVDTIEVFLFAEELEHVTELLEPEMGMRQAAERIIEHSAQWGKGTNLAASLQTFLTEHRSYATSDTVVIIVSDTKTLCLDEAEAKLALLGEMTRDTLWLNTLPRQEWDRIPSVARFSRHVKMFECNTLAHLERIVRDEVLKYPY